MRLHPPRMALRSLRVAKTQPIALPPLPRTAIATVIAMTPRVTVIALRRVKRMLDLHQLVAKRTQAVWHLNLLRPQRVPTNLSDLRKLPHRNQAAKSRSNSLARKTQQHLVVLAVVLRTRKVEKMRATMAVKKSPMLSHAASLNVSSKLTRWMTISTIKVESGQQKKPASPIPTKPAPRGNESTIVIPITVSQRECSAMTGKKRKLLEAATMA